MRWRFLVALLAWILSAGCAASLAPAVAPVQPLLLNEIFIEPWIPDSFQICVRPPMTYRDVQYNCITVGSLRKALNYREVKD